MKIIELEFLGPPAIGGVEKYVEEICKAFYKKNNETEIWCSDLLNFNGKKIKNKYGKIHKTKIIRFKSIRLPFPPKIIIPGLFLKLLFFKEKNTILHTHSLSFHTFLGLLFHKKFKKVFFVLHYNTDDLKIFLKKNKDNFIFKLIKYFSKKKNITLFSVTPSEKKVYNSIGIDSHVIPNGVNLKEFDSITSTEILQLKKEYKLDKKFKILSAGRIHKNKGLDILIKSFKKLNIENSQLIIAGIDDGYLNYLKKLSYNLGLKNKIIFTGKIPRKKFISFFKCCDVFVLPSIAGECFGIVLAEAMSCNIPVIGTNFDGLPDVIKNGSGLLFKKGDPIDLYKQLNFIYQNPQEAKKMGFAGRNLTENEYNWEKISKLYLEQMK